MKVAYLLKKDSVIINSDAADYEQALSWLHSTMMDGGNVDENERYYYQKVLSNKDYRKCVETFMGYLPYSSSSSTQVWFVNGVVILATACYGIKSPGIVALTIPNGIYFPSESMSNNPARIFFSVAYPDDKSLGHIELAYKIEKMFDDDAFKDALINAKSAEDFIKFIDDKENGNFSALSVTAASVIASLNAGTQEKSPQNNNSTQRKRGSSMAISLRKGQKVDLTKGNPSLTKILVGLGWSEQKYDGAYDFDLDAAAFLLGANGKVNSDDDFVFYNNLKHFSGSVEHMGDELTGASDGEEGDQEQIKIDLALVPANVEKIDFTVTIYDADVRKQTFGQVSNAYIRVVDDATGKELIRYDLGEDFSIETAVVVGEIYRNKGEWKFNAIGSGWQGGLAALGKNFGVNV